MPGQARIITPNTTDARPCRPSVQRIFLICVREVSATRSNKVSISYLPFGLTFAPRNLHGVDARPLPPPRSALPEPLAWESRLSLGCRARRRLCVNRLREVEDLTRELEQLFVLPVLFLDGLPLLVGDGLTLRVRPVLADHHECREEDRFERDDHRQQSVRVPFDAEPDPAAEPGDVDVDERHRAGERGDPVGHPV